VSTEHPASARWLALFAYVPLFGVLALASRSREARWHARNGFALFVLMVTLGGLATLVSILVPSLSCLYAVAMAIVGVLFVAIDVLAAVKAFEGARLLIPGISTYASRLSAADR
jgi:uncharacterized membrane protein